MDGTWTVWAPGAADGGKHLMQITAKDGKFHATSSYTVKGKPYSWTMDGTISRSGKVDVVMTHSAAGEIKVSFQLSADGKSFQGGGGDLYWIRP